MPAEENKDVVRRFVADVWNTKSPALAREILSPEYTVHFAGYPTMGYEQYMQYFPQQLQAWPDVEVSVEIVIADGNMVGIRYTWQGTHSAEAYGVPATGKRVGTQGNAFYRVMDGRIVEGWIVEDINSLLQQLRA